MKLKQGDKVYHHEYGWGTFRWIRDIDKVSVDYGNEIRTLPICLLSFTEYKIVGMSQERPKESLLDQILGAYKERPDYSHCLISPLDVEDIFKSQTNYNHLIFAIRDKIQFQIGTLVFIAHEHISSGEFLLLKK